MFFKPKKGLPSIKIYSHGILLYQGLLKDIPLKESVLIEKSIYFFNDPEPCHIHRNAVRVRLMEELSLELKEGHGASFCPLLSTYADFPHIDAYEMNTFPTI